MMMHGAVEREARAKRDVLRDTVESFEQSGKKWSELTLEEKLELSDREGLRATYIKFPPAGWAVICIVFASMAIYLDVNDSDTAAGFLLFLTIVFLILAMDTFAFDKFRM